MKCPQCGEIQHYPCPACVKRRIEKVITWSFGENGDILKCGNCGLTMTDSEWMDEESRQLIGENKVVRYSRVSSELEYLGIKIKVFRSVLHLADVLCPSCGKKMLHATDHIRCCSTGCELNGKRFKLPSVVLEEIL